MNLKALWPFGKKKFSVSAPFSTFDGSRFPGAMSPAEVLSLDYYTLRVRSRQLFSTNIYALGLIRRLVLSKVSTGITLESQITGTIGDSEELAELSDTIERNFGLWAEHSRNCDYDGLSNFYKQQYELEQEAMLSGDALVVLHFDKKTKNTKVQVIPGDLIKSGKPQDGNTIKHGVELDAKGRQVAYHVKDITGKIERISAYGRKSGRRIAWMYYPSGQRLKGAVRGTPLLGVVMQSIQELDKYRNAKVRSAVLNSILAMWIEKTEDRPSTLPMTGAAVRKDTVKAGDSVNTRDYEINTQGTGIIVEELAKGERIHPYQGNQSVEGYRQFEEAVIDAIAWSNGIPPEILKMAFNSNYSASQAAKNEYVQVIRVWRETIASDFCQPIYEDWLLNTALQRKISMPEMVASFRDKERYLDYSAWVSAEWTGTIVPTVDILKNIKAYKLAVETGFMTWDRATKEVSGMKFDNVIKRVKKEREKLIEAGLVAPIQTEETPDEDIDNSDING